MMRKHVIFVLTVLLLISTITTTLLVTAERDYQLRGYVDPVTTASLPYRIPRLGVNVALEQYQPAQLDQHFRWMKQANIHWIRQFAYWDQIEREPGSYDWVFWDRITQAADAYDLKLVVVFMNTPQWARQLDVVTAPPDDLADFSQFVSVFAERYADSVDYYQIWDEPNLDDAWGQRDPRPAEYAALLADAHKVIHANDPQATVIAGALAPTAEKRGQNIADIHYLQQLYDLGASRYFDAVAAKPYGFDTSPADRTVSIETLNFSRIVAMREVMVANGDSNKALWASNWGWNSLPADWSGEPSIWGNVTSQERIDYTMSALDRSEREWPWLGGMILHHWQPNRPISDPQWGFAVVDKSGKPSPLWEALAGRQTSQLATNGLYHPRTKFARYSGLWTFGELGADIGWLETSDSQLEFDFAGRDLSLLLREDDYFAFLYPTVDGQQANATPRDANGNAYVLLRSGSASSELRMVPISHNLADAPHTLRLTTDRGEDRWALAGFAVSSGNLAQPFVDTLSVLYLTTLLALLLFCISLYKLSLTAFMKRSSNWVSYLSWTYQIGVSVITSIAMILGMLLVWGGSVPDVVWRETLQTSGVLLLSGGLVALNPAIVLVIASCFILFILIYHRIVLGLWLIIFWAPFFLFPVELYIFAFPMAEISLFITFAAWMLRILQSWGTKRQLSNSQYPLHFHLKFSVFDFIMLAWVILPIMALTWSAQLDPALTELRKFFIQPAMFYLILRATPLTARDNQQLVNALVASGVIVSSIGIVMYAMGTGIITAENGTQRLASVYGSPNNLGLYLGRCIPIALALLLFTQRISRERVLWGLCLLAMLVAVVLTQSVGALLVGIPTGIVSVIMMRFGKRALPFIVAGGLLALGVVFALTQVSPRFASLLDLTTGTNFIRIRVWESALEIIEDHPITGLGLDQFLYAFRGEYIRPDAIFDPDLSHPHNIILDFWIRLGIPGIVILAGIIITYMRTIFIALRHQTRQSPILIGLIGAMLATFSHGLIDNSVFVDDLVLVFVLILALTARITNNRPLT